MRGELRQIPVKQGSGIKKSGRVFGQGQKAAKTTPAGLYARVSTLDQQTLPMQNRAMREYADRRGWIIAMQVKEVGSGATQCQLRDKLLEAARRREIDVVLVWRLDRWGRSVTDLLATLRSCDGWTAGCLLRLRARDPG
jgi:predicted site-specific integrase-resolvase